MKMQAPLPKSIKNIKTATAQHKASMRPFPRAGPCVTARVTNPQSLFCWLSVGEAPGLSVQISSRWAAERKIVKQIKSLETNIDRQKAICPSSVSYLQKAQGIIRKFLKIFLENGKSVVPNITVIGLELGSSCPITGEHVQCTLQSNQENSFYYNKSGWN